MSDFSILKWPLRRLNLAHPLNERLVWIGQEPGSEELVGLQKKGGVV